MVWCTEHNEKHKGKLRKYACAYAKAYGTGGMDFKTWFNRNLVTIHDMYEDEVMHPIISDEDVNETEGNLED